MNKFDIIVTDTLGMEHKYYVETDKSKKEIMNDINRAWGTDTGIQINYIDESLDKDKECICIFDNKKVVSVDIKRRPDIEELIKKINFTAVHSVPDPKITIYKAEQW